MEPCKFQQFFSTSLATCDDQVPKPFMQRTKPKQKVPLIILKSWCILHCIHTVPFGTYVKYQMDPCQLYCEIL
jgi:hypothetical protein